MSFPKFHYNDLLPTCCGLSLVGDILTRQDSLSCRYNKSATSWQLPRLWGSYGETCLMNFRQKEAWHANHRRRLHRGSGKNAPVHAAQAGQKYHFCPGTILPRLYSLSLLSTLKWWKVLPSEAFLQTLLGDLAQTPSRAGNSLPFSTSPISLRLFKLQHDALVHITKSWRLWCQCSVSSWAIGLLVVRQNQRSVAHYNPYRPDCFVLQCMVKRLKD